MFRPCNRAIVRLFNRDHQIDYIIGVFFGGGGGDEISPVRRDLVQLIYGMSDAFCAVTDLRTIRVQ